DFHVTGVQTCALTISPVCAQNAGLNANASTPITDNSTPQRRSASPTPTTTSARPDARMIGVWPMTVYASHASAPAASAGPQYALDRKSGVSGRQRERA